MCAQAYIFFSLVGWSGGVFHIELCREREVGWSGGGVWFVNGQTHLYSHVQARDRVCVNIVVLNGGVLSQLDG